MPRGVAHSPETRSYLMGLHAQGRSLSELSRTFEIPRQVLSSWWQRFQRDGLPGLAPRSRRPHRSEATAPAIVRRILQLRRRPSRRYEKSRPGELLHLDIKFLPALRNARYDYEFAAVDDFSREAVVQIATEGTSVAAAKFLEHVVAALPYRIEAVLTDNAWAFTMRYARYSDRLTRFQEACRGVGIAHYLVRPHRPQSNGKVERFFRTVDDECLALQRRWTFMHRIRAIERFVWFYNHERPHLSLNGMTPIQRRDSYFGSSAL